MISQLGLGALAVAGAAAIMIPPNVALEQDSTSMTSSFLATTLRDPFSIKLSAPCPGCPYAEHKDGKIVWTQGTDSALFIDIASGKEMDTLELNGVQIYPPFLPEDLASSDTVLTAPKVPQFPSTVTLNSAVSDPERWLSRPLTMTSWGLAATTVHSAASTGEEIIKIQLSISALEGKPIKMPYDVVITALKNPEVRLMVLNVELQNAQNGNCHGMPLLCKWKSMLANIATSVRGKMSKNCQKMHHPAYISAAEQHKAEELKKPHHGPHHHVGEHQQGERPHHGHHMHDHHHHHVLNTIARVLLSVFIPLLLGIMAGILTYTVGMLLGTAVAILWMRFKGRRTNYQPIALDDEEQSDEGLEKGYLKDEAYVEAPPVYIEVEAKEVSRPE